jgi:hypothetical protein
LIRAEELLNLAPGCKCIGNTEYVGAPVVEKNPSFGQAKGENK